MTKETTKSFFPTKTQTSATKNSILTVQLDVNYTIDPSYFAKQVESITKNQRIGHLEHAVQSVFGRFGSKYKEAFETVFRELRFYSAEIDEISAEILKFQHYNEQLVSVMNFLDKVQTTISATLHLQDLINDYTNQKNKLRESIGEERAKHQQLAQQKHQSAALVAEIAELREQINNSLIH